MLLYIFLTTTQQSGGTEWTLELVLSLIAIIISVCCVVFEYFGSKRINKISLEADLYRDLYRDYLLKRIPEARNVIHYNNNIVSDTNDLIDVLNDIRRDSIFSNIMISSIIIYCIGNYRIWKIDWFKGKDQWTERNMTNL